MMTVLAQSVRFTLAAMVLFGGAYHDVLWSVGRAAFPWQADGSLLRGTDGRVAGSRLIAQPFTRAEYFHSRPSAVAYDAAGGGGSNRGPSTPEHLHDVRLRLDALVARERVAPSRIPGELVTASGSGLDPHMSPAAAVLQAARVAASRGVPLDRVQILVDAHAEPPTFGLLGRARVNVLELNLALDEAFGAPAATGGDVPPQ